MEIKAVNVNTDGMVVGYTLYCDNFDKGGAYDTYMYEYYEDTNDWCITGYDQEKLAERCL